jgi:hypothetical protein
MRGKEDLMKQTLGLHLLRLSIGAALVLPFAACDDDEGSPTPATDAARTDATADAPIVADAGSEVRMDAPMADVGGDVAPDAGAGDGGDGGDGGSAGPVLTAEQTRGKYLVDTVIGCPDCHTPRLPTGALDMTRYMAGHSAADPCLFSAPPPSMDCVRPRNLTNDPTGLKNRTADDIKKMLKEGKRPAATGDEALFPVMPYYIFANMADADLNAIVAYLRTIPAVKNEVPKRGDFFNIPAPAPALTLAKVPLPADSYPQKEAAMRGRYLAAQSGLCVECHTEHLKAGPTALNENKIFQGGEDFTGALGPMFTMPIRTKNLTPDPTTGIGNWTIEEIVKALKLGVDKMNKGICPPMPSGMAGYGRLTDQDATDIAHYLKSIPPAVNEVKDECALPPPPG